MVVGNLEFRRAIKGNGAEILKAMMAGQFRKNRFLTLWTGFQCFEIRFNDENVIEFLKSIGRLFDSTAPMFSLTNAFCFVVQLSATKTNGSYKDIILIDTKISMPMLYFISTISFLFLFYVVTATASTADDDDVFLAFVKGEPNFEKFCKELEENGKLENIRKLENDKMQSLNTLDQKKDFLIQMYEAHLGGIEKIEHERKECEKLRKYLDILYEYLFRVYLEAADQTLSQQLPAQMLMNTKQNEAAEMGVLNFLEGQPRNYYKSQFDGTIISSVDEDVLFLAFRLKTKRQNCEKFGKYLNILYEYLFRVHLEAAAGQKLSKQLPAGDDDNGPFSEQNEAKEKAN
uniref:Uncharacterized protein n=1 Tax=Globodera rostochiensis TaxID=31243 RepID=A0A914GVE8_GLORO